MKNKLIIIFVTLIIFCSSFLKISTVYCYNNAKRNTDKKYISSIEKVKINKERVKMAENNKLKGMLRYNKDKEEKRKQQEELKKLREQHLAELKAEKQQLAEQQRLAQLEAEKYTTMEVPNHSVFKSYMPYSAITLKSSQQYVLQSQAYTDENGLRKIGDYYLVAMGQYYGTIGDKFRITMSSGQQFNVIMGDMKKYEHTFNGEGKIGADNLDLFEFIVDSPNLNSTIRRDGSVNCIFNGNVEKIEKEK